MIHSETVKNLGQAEMDIEKLQKKAEVAIVLVCVIGSLRSRSRGF